MSGTGAEFVTRGEMDSLRAELQTTRAELNAKLDQILNGRTSDAFSMGGISVQIAAIKSTQDSQALELSKMRDEIHNSQEAPKDMLWKLLMNLLKGAALAGGGYLLALWKKT
jgi:hypothetical protein